MTASPLFAQYCVPLIMEKLSSDLLRCESYHMEMIVKIILRMMIKFLLFDKSLMTNLWPLLSSHSLGPCGFLVCLGEFTDVVNFAPGRFNLLHSGTNVNPYLFF